jgi:hypothetical protein
VALTYFGIQSIFPGLLALVSLLGILGKSATHHQPRARRLRRSSGSQRREAVAVTCDQEKPRIAASARIAPSNKDQARQAEDTVASQVGNGSPSSDGSGERYGAHCR